MSSELADAGERGTLDIDQSVLRKIVEHAADQAPGTRHRSRTVAGLGVGGDAGPSAKISSGSGGLDVRLNLALSYPSPIRSTVADVRERITRDLDRLTGQQVRSLSVDVDALQGDRVPDSPRVQ
ncbi:putative alkaline shock family protein YloU [Pseudonocardia sediminis]|uniref:Putative alkaline shock family protein YloU n=1 Tax=Pseudonocardia sediminis TaxID=1397368 RepID=A0A4Q7UWD8_PSEST|nr:Asp23/Gls24 family envelope stress response protein [Pseudonocardia sediminis]RZT85298.1 putative alkaline shock family protein YloU [Pseudonocardia sediminis]